MNRVSGISGIVLGLAALVAGTVYHTRPFVISILAIVSAVLLMFFFIGHYESFRAFSKKRSTHLRLNNAVMIGLFVFIVVLLNLIVRQYYFRFDNSLSGRFSLSPQSRSVAEMLRDEVKVLFFGVEGDNDFRRMRDLLEACRYLNRNIVFRMYDLDRVPLLAKEYHVKEYNTLVAVSGKKTAVHTGADEETLTNLLIKTGREEVKSVLFLSGYGGRSPFDKGRAGYSMIADRLVSQGYTVGQVELEDVDSIPGDTGVLVIPGVTSPLSNDDIREIVSFGERGGKFLLLIDDPAPVVPLLARYGLAVSDNPVFDPVHMAGGDRSAPLVSIYVPGGITNAFNVSTVYPGVYAVRTGEAIDPFRFKDIALTSRDSWFDRNGDGVMQSDERIGPATIAGVLSSSVSLMKGVIFGDADFVSNAFVSVAGNENMFMNALNWLSGEGGLAKIEPMRKGFIPMYITKEQADLVRLFVPIGIPVVIGVLGIFVWYKRRSL